MSADTANTLALCMIVRDESHAIGDAIRSFHGVADEIIVVDTGSTDDTIEVAESLGAKVLRHPWADDFAAARMTGLRAIHAQWVFVLDADERLLPESKPLLKPMLLQHPEAEAFIVTRRDLHPGGVSEMPFVRLARIDLSRSLIGRIHEHVEPSFTRIVTSPLVIEHTGYIAGRNDARLRRNLRLLQLELADRPGQPYYLADLAHTAWLLRDPHWASAIKETFQRLDLSRATPPFPLAAPLLEIILASPAATLPAPITHQLAGSLAERWYPKSIPLLIARARVAFGRSDFAAAVELATQAIAAWESRDYDRSISFDPKIIGAELRLNLGVALARLGRADEALQQLRQAAADPQFATPAMQNILAIESALNRP